jgi:hypothetical protein
MRGRPKRQLGHGLAAQPSWATRLRGLLRAHAARTDAVTTRRPATGRRGGVLTGGSAVAQWWQVVVGDLEEVTRKVSDKEERIGAHRNDGSTVRWCKRHRSAAFVGGEGAPVVAGGGDEVLQLGRGGGVRDLQEILGIGSSGRSSPGGWRTAVVLSWNPRGRGGCRWPEAAVWVRGAVGKLGRSREGVGEEWGWEDEWSSASGSAAARQRGKRREKSEGVPDVGVPRGTGVPWGLAPTGGRCPAAV